MSCGKTGSDGLPRQDEEDTKQLAGRCHAGLPQAAHWIRHSIDSAPPFNAILIFRRRVCYKGLPFSPRVEPGAIRPGAEVQRWTQDLAELGVVAFSAG